MNRFEMMAANSEQILDKKVVTFQYMSCSKLEALQRCRSKPFGGGSQRPSDIRTPTEKKGQFDSFVRSQSAWNF
jgi:hypothetical protein